MASTEMNADDILDRLKSEFHSLYRRYGIPPTHFLVSRDVIQMLIEDKIRNRTWVGMLENENGLIGKIWGLELIECEGTCVMKAAILNDE